MSEDETDARSRAKVTLHDVAREAGVSKSTVSRLLDDRVPTADSPKARMVREVAQRLGYIRDLSAANLRRGSTGMIGVIVPRLTDTVMAMLYEAISLAAAAQGRFAIVATTDDNPEASQRAAEALIRRGVDGLVMTTARADDPFTETLRARGVPIALALRHNGTCAASVGDDQLGGYLATRHLLDLGHRKIGIIAGPDYASSSLGRLAGYRQAMAEAGVTEDPHYIVPSTFSIESGETAAHHLLTLASPPTAIFAINDNTAIGSMSAIAKAGLSVPGDISLVGYNDIPIVSRLPVPLTTVRVPFDRIAEVALQILFEDGADHTIRLATPSLIPRKSTAPLT